MAIKMYDGSDKAFTNACDKANVKPTRRQFRKWKQGRGAASNAHHEQQNKQQDK